MTKREHSETIVAAGMRIDGELKSHGNIRIDGMVSGKVISGGDVVIGEGAIIEADITAVNASIAGSVRGNVTVKNSILLAETAYLLGNANCTHIGIESGAFFAGQCRMVEPKKEQIKEQVIS